MPSSCGSNKVKKMMVAALAVRKDGQRIETIF